MKVKGIYLTLLIFVALLVGLIKSLPAESENLEGMVKGIFGENKMKECPPGMSSNFLNICKSGGKN